MKYSEFFRWLRSQGVEMIEGKGSHKVLRLNGKQTALQYHGAKEVPKGTLHSVKKTLGLK